MVLRDHDRRGALPDGTGGGSEQTSGSRERVRGSGQHEGEASLTDPDSTDPPPPTLDLSSYDDVEIDLEGSER